MGRILSKTEQRQRFTRCRAIHVYVARSRRPGEYSGFVAPACRQAGRFTLTKEGRPACPEERRAGSFDFCPCVAAGMRAHRNAALQILFYSYRTAANGSMRIARRAGM